MPFTSQAYLKYVDTATRTQLDAENVPLGVHPKTGDTFYLPERDRYAGMYVMGVQGVGKSGFLETLIHHDCQVGNAIVVIDPHGDLTNNCLAALPPERVSQAYVLEMEDEAYPFGVNLFAVGALDSDIKRTQAVDRIMHLFEVLWDDVLSQQNLPRYVRAATITLLANPGATLVDMYDFFLDDAVRTRMVCNVTDPTVRQFWAHEYDQQSSVERTRRVQPLINRLEHLFMGRSLVRNIVGQRRTSISFREAAEQKRIVFIKLPVKTVAQDARLIGTILIAQLSAAIFSFADMPEAQRPGLSLYVDEFQHFTTSDFSELFTEGRKFGVKVTVAHQYRNQLPTFLQDATMTARTKVIFQTTVDDGRELGSLFPAPAAGVDPDNISTAVDKVLRTRTSDFPPHVQTFVHTYLIPLQANIHGGRVDIGEHWGIRSMGKLLWYGALKEVQKRSYWVDDPTDRLNSLFYECMRTGHANLPIPWEIAIGFCATGGGFFSAIKGPNDTLLPGFPFPPHLVIDGKWTRKPETASERLLCFVFHLRQTMSYLAKHPVGKMSAPSANAVGQMLTQMPRRAAFVRSGEDVGVIYSLQTPKQVSGREIAERMQTIRDQTRATYCHPREEIERQILNYADMAYEQPMATGSTIAADEQAAQTPVLAMAQVYPPRYARWEEVDGDDI
jgi:hypothetical protein